MRRFLAVAAVTTMLSACGSGEPPGGPSPSPIFPPQTEPSPAAATAAPTGPTEAAAAPSLDDVEVRLEPVVELEAPIAMAVREGDDALYIAERPGVVQVLRGGEVGDPLLDISDATTTEAERGLLGLAFSPNGDELYVSYTDTGGDSRIDAYPMSDEGVDVGGRREVLRVEQPYANHNGGNVLTGPDGMLWFGLGDGGSADDPLGNGQDLGTLLGAMLRIDPRAGDGYGVPDDNAFIGREGARPEIHAYGLRNPWRFSFDRETDDLWIADVGQNRVEEINVVSLEQAAGANFEWNRREGDLDFAGGEARGHTVGPLFTYELEEGRCAVTGGYVYRGAAIPGLGGAYVFTDFCRGQLRALTREGDEVTAERHLGPEVVSPVSFGEDHDGELYVLSLAGVVYRLVPA